MARGEARYVSYQCDDLPPLPIACVYVGSLGLIAHKHQPWRTSSVTTPNRRAVRPTHPNIVRPRSVAGFLAGVDVDLRVAARGFLTGHTNWSPTKACTRWTSPKAVLGMQTTYADCNSHRWTRADGATERLCCVRWKFVRRDDDFGEACPAVGDVDVCLLFVD